MRGVRTWGWGALVGCGLVACGALTGAEDDEPPALGTTDASADATVDASEERADAEADAGVDAGPCPVGAGPTMAIVTSGNVSVCVDLTEVTSSQYGAYWDAVQTTNPTTQLPTSAPAACGAMSGASLSTPNAPRGALPQVKVSFCSAAHYCAAQGKRLCGGADGKGVVQPYAAALPTLEWELACASGQAPSNYPWPGGAAAGAGLGCRTLEADAGGPRDAGAAALCGPPSGNGPWDMMGNVWEWVDLRSDQDAGGASYTAVRGGSFKEKLLGGCSAPHGLDAPLGTYALGNDSTGFRCCATPR